MQKLFEKNIKYFYYNMPEYYRLITSIKTKRYKIKNDNILDTKTGEFLYPHSINEDSRKIAFYPTHNPLWEKHFFTITPKEWRDEKFFITGKIVDKLIQTSKNSKGYTEGFYFDKNFLPTTVLFGILAGKHIELLVENFEFQSLFVYEPNPEFFALSLYFVDYEKIYKKLNDRFFFWVKGTLQYEAIEKFYYERIVSSTFMNLSFEIYKSRFFEDAKQKFKHIRESKIRGWGTFEDELTGIKNHFQNINRYPLLSKLNQKEYPVCIVANGKSLEKNIEFIRKNKDSMLIISVGTALKPLLKAGIESDFHIEQERIPLLKEALKGVLDNYNGIFLGASVVDPDVFKMAKNPLMYIRDGFTLQEDYPFLFSSTPVVGNAGVAFACYISKNIYLCGMDLGYRIGERKHAKGSFYDDKNDTEKNGIKIKGNFEEFVYTDSLLLSSKLNLEKTIKFFKVNVYNLSDGAYIEGATPLKEASLPNIDKETFKKEILQLFSEKKYRHKDLDLTPLLNSLNNILNIEPKNLKELTGVLDFIEDRLKEDTSKEATLLKGSFFHILSHLYILAHKIDLKDYPKLTECIKKHIHEYEIHLKKAVSFS